jgi:hypothetical protein
VHRTQLIRGTPSIAPDGEKKITESSLILREILGPGGNGGAGAEVTATCRWIAIWMARAAHFDPKAIGSVSGPERNRLWARRVRTATLCSPYWVFTRSCARAPAHFAPVGSGSNDAIIVGGTNEFSCSTCQPILQKKSLLFEPGTPLPQIGGLVTTTRRDVPCRGAADSPLPALYDPQNSTGDVPICKICRRGNARSTRKTRLWVCEQNDRAVMIPENARLLWVVCTRALGRRSRLANARPGLCCEARATRLNWRRGPARGVLSQV